MNILRTETRTNQTTIVTLENAVAMIEREHALNPLRIAEQLESGRELFTNEGAGSKPLRTISYRKEYPLEF